MAIVPTFEQVLIINMVGVKKACFSYRADPYYLINKEMLEGIILVLECSGDIELAWVMIKIFQYLYPLDMLMTVELKFVKFGFNGGEVEGTQMSLLVHFLSAVSNPLAKCFSAILKT